MNRRIIAFALLFLALSGIADAIDITNCTDLNVANTVYTLTADWTTDCSNLGTEADCLSFANCGPWNGANGYCNLLYGTPNVCFNVSANNVTLDCAGHYSPENGITVLIANVNYTTIKNCNIHFTGTIGDENWYWLNASNSTGLAINNSEISCVSLKNVNGANLTQLNISDTFCRENAIDQFALSLNSTNNTIVTKCNLSSGYIGDIGVVSTYPLRIDNNSYSNRFYNNYFLIDSGGGLPYTPYVYFDDNVSLTNTFNTTKQFGERVYSNGSEIGGNYWVSVHGGGTYMSSACPDANTDGFCDYPFVLSPSPCLGASTEEECEANSLCAWDDGDCSDIYEISYCTGTLIVPCSNLTTIGECEANSLCFWDGDSCGDAGDSCSDASVYDCEAGGWPGCSLYVNTTLLASYNTDALPYSDDARVFIMKAFDESTGSRIYFTATIANSTSTTNTGYQYLYQASSTSITNGQVSVVVSNTTYYQSKYIGTIPAGGNSNLDAYLQPLSNLNIKQVSFLTTSASSQALPGVLVSINRLVNGATVSVGQAYTDSTGMASFFMDSTVSYTVTASMLGYSTVTQTIMPTQTTYTITMGNWTIGMFHQTFYDIQWTFAPTGILDENKTHNLTFSTFSSTGKIVWFAWKIYNDTTLLRFENVSSPIGGTINYSLRPGPNSNITIYFYIMRANMSEQQLAIWWMPLPVQSFINGIIGDINRYIASNQTLTSVLKNLGNQANNWRAFPNAISSFTLVLGTLIVGVITSAWVGRFSPTGGQLVFVIVMAVGTYMGAGLLASVSLLIFIIIVAVAYQLWRSGG